MFIQVKFSCIIIIIFIIIIISTYKKKEKDNSPFDSCAKKINDQQNVIEYLQSLAVIGSPTEEDKLKSEFLTTRKWEKNSINR